jgi:hypothetical protein
MKLIDLSRYGPVHRFADYHVYKALAALSDGRRKGRKQLSQAVGVGEGSMRTIIEYLRDHELIDVKQTGISISNKGVEFLNGFPIQVGALTKTDATLGLETVAVLVRGNRRMVKIGVEQRDAAVRAGADGATTILIQGGELWVPPDFNLDKERPDFAAELRGIFSVREGDVIIIGTGPDYHHAEDGALAAAFELI